MAVTIDSDSRFTRIAVIFSSSYITPHRVACEFDDDDDSYLTIVVGNSQLGYYPAEGTDAYGDLEALQDLNGSDDGFQDADGNSITPVVASWGISSDIDELEAHGLFNPLLSGSYGRWIANKKIEGAHFT